MAARTYNTNARQEAGLTAATARHNATVPTPLTEAQYFALRVEQVLDSWANQLAEADVAAAIAALNALPPATRDARAKKMLDAAEGRT